MASEPKEESISVMGSESKEEQQQQSISVDIPIVDIFIQNNQS